MRLATVCLICRDQCVSVSRFLVWLDGVVNLHALEQRVCTAAARLHPFLLKLLEDQRQTGDDDRLSLDFQSSFLRWSAASTTGSVTGRCIA